MPPIVAEAPEASTVDGDDLGVFAGLDMGTEGTGFDSSAADSESNTADQDDTTKEPSSETSGQVTSDTTEVKPETPKADEDQDAGASNYEKRFKDTQKAFNDERQARLDLERKFEEFQKLQADGTATKAQEKEVNDILSEFKEKFDEDPEEAIASALRLINEKVNQVNQSQQDSAQQRQAETEQRINREEELVRKEIPDYDEFVDPEFLSELTESPALIAQWQKMGGKPKDAYELAKRTKAHKVYLETGSLPDYALSKEPAPPAKEVAKEPQTLGDISSSPPVAKAEGQLNNIDDVNRALGLTL